MPARHTAVQTADYVIAYCLEGRAPKTSISNLQLQKILFFIQMKHCQQFNGEFLFDDDFEAWKYGPVVPDVYYKYSIWGGLPIDEAGSPEKEHGTEFNKGEREIIVNTVEQWVDRDPWELVAASHEEGTPWHITYNNGAGMKQIIDKRLIRDYALK